MNTHNENYKFASKMALALGSILIFSGAALAENIIRTPAPVIKAVDQGMWSIAEPFYTDWVSINESNCSAWLPLAENVMNGSEYTQISNCDADQVRTKTDREVNSKTGLYRPIGEAVEETRTVSISKSRASVGTGNFSEEYFVVGWGNCPYWQYGYSNNGTCSNNVFYEGSVSSGEITYFTYGYGSAINFGLNPAMIYSDLVYLRVEMIDDAGDVYYVDEYTGGFMPQAGSYIGPKHTSEAFNKATLAKKFRVTYRRK